MTKKADDISTKKASKTPAKVSGHAPANAAAQMSLFDAKTESSKTVVKKAAPAAVVVAAPVTKPAVAKRRAAGQHGGKKNETGTAAAYTGADIQILEGVQHIRQRPGMYIGSTSTSGLLHLIYEAVDNVVDEFAAGFGSTLHLTIEQNGRVTVRDEARGIPIDPKESGGVVLPAAAWIFLKPFTGGKFEAGAYKQAGGLHGVGLTVINALSSELVVDIWRDNKHYHQEFRHGGSFSKPVIVPYKGLLHGTQIAWLYDQTIFDEDVVYDIEALTFRFEATACLNRGLKIDFTYWDEEEGKNVNRAFHSEKGLVDYVQRLMPGGAPLIKLPISIARTREDVSLEVALQPDSRSYKTQILSFANGVRTT
ncbi:MAG: ATP-binding protein, partial [Dehalococcoidia bacterium]|nr:ATP-binding protein [Dehalococcoidia bacterium]